MGKILITGGAGYIGSHTCIQLQQAGRDILVLDNLCNASEESLHRVAKITGKKVDFIKGDMRDREVLKKLFQQHEIDSVIHFAGLKAVGESVEIPLTYYENNINGSIILFQEMANAGVKTIVFSSSATVYGDPATVPIKEDFPLSATNAYGRSKLFIEEILHDVFVSDSDWKVALLRYFNPVGAHSSGTIGEDPSGIPNNLMPFISQTAVGKREKLSVFGGDYDTPDGTGVRDYIHVVDLARGHLNAIEALEADNKGQVLIVNLGTGQGYSVLDMVKAFEKASGQKVAYEIVARRAGDIATCYADPALAKKLLNWQAEYGVEQMCEDTWRWQSNNPDGYK